MPLLPLALLILASGQLRDTGRVLPPDLPVSTIVPADSRFTALRDKLLARVRAGEIPSVAIAARMAGHLVWEEAIGWADREHGVPATPETSYALGSLSKSLASTAILSLVDRGILALDVPVNRWLPLPGPTGVSTQPTLRQLLDASGGVPHGWQDGDPALAPVPDSAWAAWVGRNAYLAFSPGTVFEYSNNSFGVAARVAELATGLPFARVMQRYLFDPLGMTRSQAAYAPAPGTATGYAGDGTPLPSTDGFPEAGLGMRASVADLLRFGAYIGGHGLASEQVLSPARLASLWEPSAGPSRDFFHFGFWDGGRTLVTNGNVGGANAFLAIGRDTDLVVAVAVNQTGNDADETAGAIVDLLVPPLPGSSDMRAAYAALYRRSYAAQVNFAGHWAGQALAQGGTIPFEMDAGRDSVRLRLGTGPWIPLARASVSAFDALRGSVTAEIAGLAPPGNGASRVDLTLHWEGGVLRGYLLPRGSVAQPVPVLLTRQE